MTTVRAAVVIVFVAVAVVGLLGSRRAQRPALWAVAAFTSLGLVLLLGVTEDALGVALPDWAATASVVLLVLFPYLLFRFTAAFRPMLLVLEVPAGVATAAVVVATLLQRTEAEGVSASYLALLLVTWTGLSVLAAVRLWRAGKDQPTLARRRMRLMSGATAALAVALVLAVPLGDQGSLGNLAVQSTALVAGVGFGLGFAPPRMLRLLWRQPEEELLQGSYGAFMRASSLDDVTDALLPRTVAIIGGSAAAIIDYDRRMVASYGDPPSIDDAQSPDRVEVPLAEPLGTLIVWTSPYTPFFGKEELKLLEGLAAVASLALERVELLGRDAAQRRELERAKNEAEQANAAKTDFLSRMSHELRTPMNAVLGFGQLLETELEEPVHLEWTGHILKAGRHLLSLINDVLDLSRVESGRLTVSLESVHTGELVRGTIDLIKPVAEERSISIRSDHEGLNAYIRTDRQRCTQILLNILSNAVKYNYDGGSVDILTTTTEDNLLRITVHDSGPGIAPENLDRLFEPFDRLGAETTTVEGTGLGLALSKNLAELMGGTLGVSSTPGQGSNFWVEFPVVDEPAAAAEQPALSGDSAHVDSTDEHRVLLIEDNLANLRLVETILDHRRGIGVIAAMQGVLGLELAREHQPDLVLLDLHLPDIPGEQILARLRADPRTKNIPVVIISADATPGSIQRLRQSGAADYLTKPLELDRFLEVVDSALFSNTEPTATPDAET